MGVYLPKQSQFLACLAQIGLRLINATSYAFTYVTGVANTGAKDTSTPVPTSLPTEVYLSMTPGAAANGTMFTGYIVGAPRMGSADMLHVQLLSITAYRISYLAGHDMCLGTYGTEWLLCSELRADMSVQFTVPCRGQPVFEHRHNLHTALDGVCDAHLL